MASAAPPADLPSVLPLHGIPACVVCDTTERGRTPFWSDHDHPLTVNYRSVRGIKAVCTRCNGRPLDYQPGGVVYSYCILCLEVYPCPICRCADYQKLRIISDNEENDDRIGATLYRTFSALYQDVRVECQECLARYSPRSNNVTRIRHEH